MRSCAIPCAALAALLAAASAPAFDIVKEGKAVAVIITPESPDLVAKESARLLAAQVKAATGAELAVLPESKAPDGPRISIGWTQAAAREGLSTEKLSGDSFHLRVKGPVLFIAGRDKNVDRINSYQGAKGTYLGVMRLLQEFAGVRWALPGPQGVYTPKAVGISVPDDLDLLGALPLQYAITRMDRYGDWSAANGARQPLSLYTAGGHTWVFGVPPEKYAGTHPEYFALLKGKRAADAKSKGPMLCTANPEFVPLMTAWMRAKFDEGFDIVQLGQSDGLAPCECAECNRLYGPLVKEGVADPQEAQSVLWRAVGRRVFIPHVEICRRIEKSHPGKLVMLLVYSTPGQYINILSRGEVKDPDLPLPFPSNVLAEVTDCDLDVLARMKRVMPNLTTYNYFWSTYHGGLSPKQSPETIAHSMRGVKAAGSTGTYFCGGCENWPAEAPGYYAGLRALMEPKAGAAALQREFCVGAYGKAAETMDAYYTELYSRIKVKPDDGVPAVGFLFKTTPRDRQLGEKYVTFWPPESIEAMGALLQKASGEAAGDARAQNWVRLAQIGFDQVRLTAGVYRAARAYEAKKSVAALREVKAALDARREFIDSVLALPAKEPAFVKEYFPNYRVFSESLDKESRSVPMGVPFTWDIDKALAKGQLP